MHGYWRTENKFNLHAIHKNEPMIGLMMIRGLGTDLTLIDKAIKRELREHSIQPGLLTCVLLAEDIVVVFARLRSVIHGHHVLLRQPGEAGDAHVIHRRVGTAQGCLWIGVFIGHASTWIPSHNVRSRAAHGCC